MSILLKFILIATLTYYVLKFAAKFIFSSITQKIVDQAKQTEAQQHIRKQQKGDLTITYPDKDNKNTPDKGEYTDYEEI